MLKTARSILASVLLLTMTQSTALSESPSLVFRAGAAASNISPPLGLSIAGNMSDSKGTHIHDDLFARCLALDDGKTKIILVLCDSCMIPREIMDHAKQIIQEETGIPPGNVLIAATHSHSAPAATHVFQSHPDPDYLQFLVRRIADGVRRALANLEPARIGWGMGREPSQVFNRRWRMKPGGIPANPFGNPSEQVRMNPPRADALLDQPAGPTDPEVAVVSVQSASGRPIALLANYSLHYVGGVGGGHVSADYFGAFSEAITQKMGAEHLDPPFVGMLSNGTSGDINNIDFKNPAPAQPPYAQIRKVAGLLAEEAARVTESIQYRPWVPLASSQTEISLAVRRPSQEEVAMARDRVGRTQASLLAALPEIYAGETLDLASYPEKVSLLLQAHRIGDLGIAAIPCEVFVEIGLEIKSKSPLKPAFTIELANGYNGYLPTPEHHRLGGYETWRAKSSYLEADAAPKITAKVLELLNEVKAETR